MVIDGTGDSCQGVIMEGCEANLKDFNCPEGNRKTLKDFCISYDPFSGK